MSNERGGITVIGWSELADGTPSSFVSISLMVSALLAGKVWSDFCKSTFLEDNVTGCKPPSALPNSYKSSAAARMASKGDITYHQISFYQSGGWQV